MPPKSRKQCLRTERAQQARVGKKARLYESVAAAEEPVIERTLSATAETGTTAETMLLACLAGDPEESDRSDATFDPDQEATCSTYAILEQFVEDWLLTLDRDNIISLSLFLTYNLKSLLNLSTTNAADYAGIMLGKSDRTIRQWHADFHKNGSISDSKQGRYQRTGILWSCEDLNKKAYQYVRESANVKGQSNLTKHSFCRWVNEELLPNGILEPGFPRCISVETARKWLHAMGFEVLAADKGMFFDGHEREDAVKEREKSLSKMVEVGFLHPSEAPTPDAARAFPPSVPLALSEVREKTVVIFHDESTFHANEDQTSMWRVKGEHMLRPKTKGA